MAPSALTSSRACAHYHAFTGTRAFTAMVIHSRVCAHLHGYAHTFMGTRTAMVMCIPARVRAPARPWSLTRAPSRPWRKPTRRDQRSGSHRSSANPTHSNTLGGMGDAGVAATSRRQGGGSSTCVVRPEGRTCDRAIGPRGPITVKPEGLTDLRARLWSGLRAGQIVEPEGSTA